MNKQYTLKSFKHDVCIVDALTNSEYRRKSCECSECGTLSRFQYQHMNTQPLIRQTRFNTNPRRMGKPSQKKSIFWQKYQTNNPRSCNVSVLKRQESSVNDRQKPNSTSVRIKTTSTSKKMIVNCYLRSPIKERNILLPLIENRVRQIEIKQNKMTHIMNRI